MGSIFYRFWDQLGLQNRSKIDQKSIKKSIQNKMQLGMDFEWLLDRFLIDSGAQHAPQNPTKIDPKGVQEQDNKKIQNI